MLKECETAVVADVNVAENLEALYVTPRDHADRLVIAAAVRAAMQGQHLRVSAKGVVIPADLAHRFPTQVVGIDLRWTAEALVYKENRSKARKHHAELFAAVTALKEGGRHHAEQYLDQAAIGDILDSHQVVNVAAMTLPNGHGLCVFDEQGAGKTVTGVFAFDVLMHRDEADFALVVAPKSMVAEWKHDFERFKGDLYRVFLVAGNRRTKQGILRARADVLVTNFETAVSMEQELTAELRRRAGRAVLIVDESFFIKSLDAKRTRALRRLREWCGRAFILCGTPAPNSAHDLVQQFSIMDFGITFGGTSLPKDRAAAVDLAKTAIEARGLYVRHLKAQVLPDLPERRFTRVHIPLEGEQRRLYEGALKRLIIDLRSVDENAFRRRLASFFAQRSALLQICSCPGALSPDYSEVPGKLRALEPLLDELVLKRAEKVVVWSYFTRSITDIFDRIRRRYGAVRYDGSVQSVDERREIVRRFQTDDETMVFVGNPAAAGAGLTLHRARYAIYESMSNQAAHYLQSLDRIHRRGQKRDVEVMVLLTAGTIEVTEYERLLGKERQAQDLMDDDMGAPPTRDAFLADAEAALAMLHEEGQNDDENNSSVDARA